MADVVIWHNPQCSKSRATLALLQERGLDVEIREYLKDPPSAEELAQVLGKLAITAEQLLRKRETEELGLAAVEGDAPILSAMADHPVLIQRPVVIRGDRAVIARPPEKALDLL